MTTSVVASLSETGWITDTRTMLDKAMSYFFVSEENQTQLFLGEITSLPYIIQSNTGSISDTITSIERALHRYLSRYFNYVEVSVSEKTQTVQSNKAELIIYIQVTGNDGFNQSLSKLVQIEESTIKQIIDLSNNS